MQLVDFGRITTIFFNVAPDLPDYIMERGYVAAALRTARDLDAGEKEWNELIEELRKRKG